MQATIVIPARYHSTRLPAKVLLRGTGKYLVQHVYEQAAKARSARRVIVATDDPRIEAAVRSFGGEVMMTRRSHASGTDRVAEVAARISAEIIVNLQGDEPQIEPEALDRLVGLLHRHPDAAMATLATPIRRVEDWLNPNCVKVVLGDEGQALYFSRSPIPHCRDGRPDFDQEPRRYFQHLGLYAYHRDFLRMIAHEPPGILEQTEKLEQLRVLAHGQRIQVGLVPRAYRGVDTPADYEAFVQSYRNQRRAA